VGIFDNKNNIMVVKKDDAWIDVFKDFLVKMCDKKTYEQLEAFAVYPSSKALGQDPDKLIDYYYNMIKKHTTEEERKRVLIELKKHGII